MALRRLGSQGGAVGHGLVAVFDEKVGEQFAVLAAHPGLGLEQLLAKSLQAGEVLYAQLGQIWVLQPENAGIHPLSPQTLVLAPGLFVAAAGVGAVGYAQVLDFVFMNRLFAGLSGLV